ncbi:MAG: competence/damage-inducible protein A [Planctomycetota bacterium]|nr:competence/damage-inducible protein A [Planctomycetota bacterium]
MRTVAVLIIGDEILHGEIRDENGPRLVKRFSEAGIQVVRLVTVPDEHEAIITELNRLRAMADAVIVSGGIGPTHDDYTRTAVALALGRDLEAHPEAEDRIRGYYGDRVTDAELSMAQFPMGARIVSGLQTKTFGFEVEGVYALPGVPRLFKDIIEGIADEFRADPLHKVELTSSLREGEIAPRLADAQDAWTGVAIGSYPVCDDQGCWHVRVVLRSADPDRLAEVARELETHLS